MDNIGVRIPNHWFSLVIEEYGKLFISTSVNVSGKPFMKKIDDLKEEIKERIDYLIYDGPLEGNPSTIVKLVNRREEMMKR